MPRRHNRPEQPSLPDLSEIKIPKPRPPQRPWLSQADWERLQAERRGQETARNEAARLDRITKALGDWRTCIIPGCERLTAYMRPKNPKRELPLCTQHAVVVWGQIQRRHDDPDIITVAQELHDTAAAEDAKAREEDKAEYLRSTYGDMYFVRLGGLIKVGWSRDLYARLKSYGASVEILCHYPATRDDETALHRQLTPSRAKGREWYHDTDVIQMYITQAIEKHGPPSITIRWTEHSGTIRTKRRR